MCAVHFWRVTTTTNKKKTDRQTDGQANKEKTDRQTDKQTKDRHTANNKLYMTDKQGSLQYETKKNI